MGPGDWRPGRLGSEYGGRPLPGSWPRGAVRPAESAAQDPSGESPSDVSGVRGLSSHWEDAAPSPLVSHRWRTSSLFLCFSEVGDTAPAALLSASALTPFPGGNPAPASAALPPLSPRSPLPRKGCRRLDFPVPRSCYQLRKKVPFKFPPTFSVTVMGKLFLGSLLNSIRIPGSTFFFFF